VGHLAGHEDLASAGALPFRRSLATSGAGSTSVFGPSVATPRKIERDQEVTTGRASPSTVSRQVVSRAPARVARTLA